jgi:thiamine-phosphate pyrophosphorylase
MIVEPMHLIIISPPHDTINETQAVYRILKRSSATFQLRKPNRETGQLADYLQRIPADLHRRIVVHDHPQLIDRFDLKGVHFSEHLRRRQPEAIRQIRRRYQGCRISSAFHRIEDIPGNDGRFDELLLSPIFDSISKPGYRAAFAHADLRRFLRHSGHSVVALGGVDADRIAVAADLGFSGVAVLGAVWSNADPEAAAVRLSTACSRIDVPTAQAE